MKVIFLIVILVLATVILVNYVNPSLSSQGGILGKLQSFLSRFSRRFRRVKISSKASPLRRELLKRVDPATADRLISSARRRTPGKSEHWYLEKVLYDLIRGR
ncbi:MAG: hypothetical protein WA865_20160 [Spirulinaceae cyanobacterium]